jgi:hypothetical protein
MRYHQFSFFLLFFLVVFGLFASPYDMILVGESVLEDLRYLSLESGNPFLSFTPPLAPAEAEQFLNSLDPSILSAPAREAYNRVKKRLAPEARLTFSGNNLSIMLNINSTIEGKSRFNSDISWYPLYPKVPPVFSFPLRFYFIDTLQLYFEPIIAVNSGNYPIETFGTNIPSNIPYKYEDYDAHMPLRAFVAAGGSWWNFQLGRDRLFWGTGHTGSLSFSDNSAFFEFVRLSFFSDFFKYSLLVNQMHLVIDDIIPSTFPIMPEILTETTQRYYYLHRLDFSFFNRVSLSVMEGLMVGNSPLELRFLNPFVVFHSLFSWSDYENWPVNPSEGDLNGSFFSLELNWNITKNLSVYGQFVMNEWAAQGEIKSNPNQPPNELGYLAGTSFTHSFDAWGSVFFLEFIHTDPYCYILSSPFASFIQMHYSGGRQYYFIGYPRDTIALALGTRFFKSDIIVINGDFSWICRGEHDKDGLTWDWANTDITRIEKTPSGSAENNFSVSLGAEWKPLSYLTLKGSVTGILSFNNKHSGSDKRGGQAALSVSFHY